MAESMRDFVNGRLADSPWEIPRAGWKQVFKRAWAQAWVNNVSLVAAGVAFYGFLAFVPLLAAVVLIYSIAAQPETIIETLRTMFAIFPDNIAAFVGDQLLEVVRASEGQKGIALVIALAVSLYGASNGAWAVITALNITYEEAEKRRWWQVYLLTLKITFGAILVALAAVAATTVLATLDRLLPDASPVAVGFGRFAAYALLALLAAAIAATLYRFGPSREHARWRWITPGSVLSAIAWVVLSAVFGFYAARVGFTAAYGPLAAVAGFLTWLFLSAYVFLFGAELNAELEHQTARDSTTGAPVRMGERGAWAADHVAGGDEPEDVEEKPSVAEASPAAAEMKKRR